MPCTITPDGGRSITFQVNPTIVDVDNDEEQGNFKAIRGGNYPFYAGYNPETIQLEVELPDNRPSFPNARAWQPPQIYIRAIQSAIRAARGRVYVSFPEADIGAWYHCKHVREHYSGGYMDVGLTLTLTEERRISILTTSDAAAQQPGGSQGAADTAAPPPDTSTNSGDTGDPAPGAKYKTIDGDSLTGISMMAYGDTSEDHINALMAANPDMFPNSDPNELQIGVYIVLPGELTNVVG